MSKNISLLSFFTAYPDDAACLEKLKQLQYPNGIFCRKCDSYTNFTRIKRRPVYQCSCGYQVSPLASTVFHKSGTSLQIWFLGIYAMSITKGGISAKQFQRETGIAYGTAFRILHKIRRIMQPDKTLLQGIVEVDETYIGPRWARTSRPNFNSIPKAIIIGMVERKGRAVLRHIPNTGGQTLLKSIQDTVLPGTFIMSDQNQGYTNLHTHGYPHDIVVHRREFVKAGTHTHTQTIESVWSSVKRNIYGEYRHVSKKYLQHYADEIAWRYNQRHTPNTAFDDLLGKTLLSPRT